MTRLLQENITLRPWRDSDARSLTTIANCKEVADNLRDGVPYPYRLKDAEKWLFLTKKFRHKLTQHFAIESNGELVGSIGLTRKANIYRKNVEIGYFIGKKYWGQGIATIAIRMIVDYIFENFDIERIYAEPYAQNMASRRVLEKNGFTCEAVLKNYVIKNNILQDSCIYSLLRTHADS